MSRQNGDLNGQKFKNSPTELILPRSTLRQFPSRRWVPCAAAGCPVHVASRMRVGGLSERRARGQRVKSSVFLAAVFVILSFWFTLWKSTLYIHVIMMSYCSFYRLPREKSKCCQSCFNWIFYGLSSFASTNCRCAISTRCKKSG